MLLRSFEVRAGMSPLWIEIAKVGQAVFVLEESQSSAGGTKGRPGGTRASAVSVPARMSSGSHASKIASTRITAAAHATTARIPRPPTTASSP